jgi:hypothetical protein
MARHGNSERFDGRDDPEQTGKHIADMVLELRNVSHRAGLTFLTQLLEMTYHEAFMIANRVTPPKAELDEVHEIMRRARDWAAQRKRPG